MLLLHTLFMCQTPPRPSTPLEEISGVQKPHALRYIAPKEGSKVFGVPSSDGVPVAELSQNTKVTFIDEKHVPFTGGQKKSWAKIEFERNKQILSGWVMADSLSNEEITTRIQEEKKVELSIKKTIGPVVRISGRFILAECIYNTGYGSTPYYFLGDQKQNFVFHEDGTFSFDINVCSGASPEEGNFTQKERTILANVAGNAVVFELVNSNTVKIVQGAEYLSCQVCREAYLVRQGE